MNPSPSRLLVKYGESVSHDLPYLHPQSREQRQKDFFDREQEKKRINEILWFSGPREPIVLIGERRAGKSSLLELLAHALNSDPRFVAVNISWLQVNSAQKFVLELLSELEKRLGLDESLLRNLGEIHTTTEFRNIVKRISDRIPDKTIIIGIDEFDSILIDQLTSKSQQADFLGLLGALIDDEMLPVRLILTMSREPSKIETGYASLLTTKAERIRLEPFSKADLDEMIRVILQQDIQVGEQELQHIFDLSGGWPYFAKAILYYMVQFPSDDGQLEQAKERAVQDKRLSETLEHIYQKHWDDSERTVILLIAQRGGMVSQKEMQIMDPSVKIAAQELVRRGYLLETEGNYHFRIGLLLGWFMHWIRFEEQTQKYLKDILPRLARLEDPWATTEDETNEIVEVTKDEVRRRGFSL